MIKLFFRIVAVVLIAFFASTITVHFEASDSVPMFAIFGAICFFLGPYLDGAGFFVRGGNYVDKATPESIWIFFGVLLWVIGGITFLVTVNSK